MSDEVPIIQQAPQPGTIVASALAGQLGTDALDLAEGIYDMRRLSVLEKDEIRPLLYGIIRSRKNKTWRRLIDAYLNLKVSEHGRGRRDIIRMEQVSHGGMTDISSEINAMRPGWLGRNVTSRNWQEEAIREGQV